VPLQQFSVAVAPIIYNPTTCTTRPPPSSLFLASTAAAAYTITTVVATAFSEIQIGSQT
jgi:hypothetical protein